MLKNRSISSLFLKVLVLFMMLSLSGFIYGCNTKSPFRAFPQHTQYTEGTIKPDHVSQSKLDKEVGRLYDEWKKKYLKKHPYVDGQYYIWYSDGEWFQDGDEDDKVAITVSEAHGYGMVITAIMAGYDKEAKKIYDGMYQYFREHPSSFHPDLMAWRQGDKDGKIVDISGADSATDGDMDIAYSLLLADRQWGSDGDINYLAEANKVIAAIMKDEVNQEEWTLKLGDWSSDEYNFITRTSDFMMQHLKDFRTATGDNQWDNVIDKTYRSLNEVYQNYSSNTGIFPDFLTVSNDKIMPAQGEVLESEYDGCMNYNACRTSWRVATDYIVTGDDRALNQLKQLNQWIRETTDNRPENIRAGYQLDGTVLPERDYEDISFSSPFMVSAMVNESNQQWLNSLWDYNVAVPTETDYYFGNTIRLLNAIVISGNWWSPMMEQ